MGCGGFFAGHSRSIPRACNETAGNLWLVLVGHWGLSFPQAAVVSCADGFPPLDTSHAIMAAVSEVKSPSRVRLFATPGTVACQAPLPMGFSRQDYWSGLPFPSPGDLPDPGIEPGSPALQVKLLEKPISIVVPANLFSQLCLVCWWSHWRNSPCLSLYILFLVFSFD